MDTFTTAPPLAVTEALQWAGALLVASAAAAALTARDERTRARLMVLALVLTPILLIGEIWDTDQFHSLRDDPTRLATLAAAGAAAVLALAALMWRFPTLLPVCLVALLPFRIPIEAGGSTVNLLVPLYLAIAAGVVATAFGAFSRKRPTRGWRGDPGFPTRTAAGLPAMPGSGNPVAATGPAVERSDPEEPTTRRPIVQSLLAAALVLYALQSAYSNDFETALEQIVFFLVPFALMARLLLDARWDTRLLRAVFVVGVIEALAFSVVGLWEYQARELLWNPKVINSNQFENYFRVNSVFWDPNIYGRYLVMVTLMVVAYMAWTASALRALGLVAVCAVLWVGLVLSFSQSSFAALLVGLAVLAALRWSLRWTGAVSAAIVAGGLVFLVAFGSTVKVDFGSRKSLDRATSGRLDLVRGGLELVADEPITGHGSGSFARTYRRERKAGSREAASASHTEPITVAAEQGPPGLAVYLLLVAAALVSLRRGLRGLAPGLRRGGSSRDGPKLSRERWTFLVARAGILAAFAALVFHSLAYAAFLTDPVTWALLAVGTALSYD